MATTVSDDAKNFLIHLRLPFQLLLTPFMLWGAVIAHGRVSPAFCAAFVVLHVCFYGGTTAYNSHYDKDEGPIGGLEHPPPAGPWLLPGSLILQGVGLVLAWLIAPAFAGACLAFAILGVLYSHPVPRWKGSPWMSWTTVMVGQGALGGIAGILASQAGGAAPTLTSEIAWGLLGAAAIVGALYPASQLFQMDEDRARGDRTTAMVLGWRGTALATIALSIVGAVLVAASARAGGRSFEAGVLVASAIPFGIAAAWACRERAPKVSFRRVSRFQQFAGGAFAAYTLVRLVFS